MKAAALLLLLGPVQALAQGAPAPTPDYIDLATLGDRANDLRDAVADPRQSDIAVKGRGAANADRWSREQPVFVVNRHRMERAEVSGKIGDLKTMQDAAEDRVQWWRANRKRPVPAKLSEAVDMGRAMLSAKNMSFQTLLDPGQMGKFAYKTDTTQDGQVQLNERLKLVCAMIGDQFCYATALHELTHKCDRLSGFLTPENWKAGEISAFSNQIEYLRIVDERGDKLVTKHRELEIARDLERDPDLKKLYADSVRYLEHLSEVVECYQGDGRDKDQRLKDLVERLYKGKDGHDHGDGPRS